MSIAKEKIAAAYKWAIANRPRVNGYPYLAEALRQAGVTRYVQTLPSCQCLYFTKDGHVAGQMDPLTSGLTDVPLFKRDEFIRGLRISQKGDCTFPEFLKAAWDAGITHYEADLIGRKVTYYGSEGESYVEDFPSVKITFATS